MTMTVQPSSLDAYEATVNQFKPENDLDARNFNDLRLFVYDCEQSVRIRTGERGEETVLHSAPAGWGY